MCLTSGYCIAFSFVTVALNKDEPTRVKLAKASAQGRLSRQMMWPVPLKTGDLGEIQAGIGDLLSSLARDL